MRQTVQSPTFAGSRKHPRAQLNLPVRLRWPGTQGTKLERTHTIDVSRAGLLVERAEPCEVRPAFGLSFRSTLSKRPRSPRRLRQSCASSAIASEVFTSPYGSSQSRDPTLGRLCSSAANTCVFPLLFRFSSAKREHPWLKNR